MLRKAYKIYTKLHILPVFHISDYILDSKTSIEDALSKAVIQAERKAGELQIRQMIELTIKLVLSMLKNIVVGEKPIEFSAPSGLSLTIAMYVSS